MAQVLRGWYYQHVGHFKNLKKEYSELARRLNEGGMVAFVEPESDRARAGWKEMFEILYSPEEAELAAKMPLFPEALPALSKRVGIEESDLHARLDTMCDKGIVMDLIDPSTHTAEYLLSPPLVGFIEFSMMRAQDGLPKQRVSQALDDYFHGDRSFVRELFDCETPLGRALVYENEIPDESAEVFDWERASAVVKEARAIAVSLCTCRHKAQHLGEACDAPTDNCLTLNAGADFVIRRGFGRAIDQAEALRILEESRRHGLVHIADNVQGKPVFLCSCCSCCCEQLRAINRYDVRGVVPSGFVAECNADACAGCARCARACPVGAVALSPRPSVAPQVSLQKRRNTIHAEVDATRCIGCGVCADICKKDAMSMLRRKELPHVPANAVERVVRRAIERNRLADLVFEQGRGRGSRYLNQILSGILRLPPAQRIFASEQLRSRFVRAVVAKVKDPLA